MESVPQSRRYSWLEYVPFVIAVSFILYKLQPIDGWLGHDYYYSFIQI